MVRDFIERRGDGYYFIGSRMSLDSVVYQFLQGESRITWLNGPRSMSTSSEARHDLKNWRARHVRPIPSCIPNCKRRRTRYLLGADAAAISGG